MSRPIQATPIIRGEDARLFLERMNAARMTPERLAYLRECAEQSKRAEGRHDATD